MENKSLVSFDTVMRFAEINPSQKIWCISMDGRIDFLMDAGEIKKTVGNFDWNGVDFFLVGEQEERADEIKVEPTTTGEIQIAPQKLNHRVKMFAGSELSIVEAEVNDFIKNIGSAIEIEYSIARDGLNTTYSVLIHYVEE